MLSLSLSLSLFLRLCRHLSLQLPQLKVRSKDADDGAGDVEVFDPPLLSPREERTKLRHHLARVHFGWGWSHLRLPKWRNLQRQLLRLTHSLL